MGQQFLYNYTCNHFIYLKEHKMKEVFLKIQKFNTFEQATKFWNLTVFQYWSDSAQVKGDLISNTVCKNPYKFTYRN